MRKLVMTFFVIVVAFCVVRYIGQLVLGVFTKPITNVVGAVVRDRLTEDTVDYGDFTVKYDHTNLYEYISGYEGGDSAIVLPDPPGGTNIVIGRFDGVTEIEVPAHYTSVTIYSDTLKTITIPEGVMELNLSCPELESVVVPSTCVDENGMSRFSFSECTSLSDVTLPENLVILTAKVFRECVSLTSIDLPSSVRCISSSAFLGSGLESIAIPGGTFIGRDAFMGCASLRSVTIGDDTSGSTKILESAFEGSVTIGDDTSGSAGISGSAFANCISLTDVTIGTALDTGETGSFIGYQAFSGCTALENVVIGEGWESIGSEAFMNCVSLKEIALPSTMREIGASAFEGCSALTECNFPEGLQYMGIDAFYGTQVTPPQSVYEGLVNGAQYVGLQDTQAEAYQHNGYGAELTEEEQQRHYEVICDTLVDYFTSYLEAINQQDIGLLRHASASQAESLRERIYGVNSDYIFWFDQITLDRNTVEFHDELYSNGGPLTVTFNAAFQFSNRPRNEDTAPEYGGNTQFVTMVYNQADLMWIVDDARISPDITIGENKTVLN